MPNGARREQRVDCSTDRAEGPPRRSQHDMEGRSAVSHERKPKSCTRVTETGRTAKIIFRTSCTATRPAKLPDRTAHHRNQGPLGSPW